MLKITAIDNEGQRTLVVEGKLADPWLAELERTWDEVRRSSDSSTVTIDLKDVTAISERGETFLRKMRSEGAKFNCCRGILTRHVVRKILQGCKSHFRKKDVKA